MTNGLNDINVRRNFIGVISMAGERSKVNRMDDRSMKVVLTSVKESSPKSIVHDDAKLLAAVIGGLTFFIGLRFIG